ncbi:hypothetical protein TNCV_3342381 [Trichonephila clavipes]|nr:hypothetical protein TNCV_3342381 [Trichonephila clavipes]
MNSLRVIVLEVDYFVAKNPGHNTSNKFSSLKYAHANAPRILRGLLCRQRGAQVYGRRTRLQIEKARRHFRKLTHHGFQSTPKSGQDSCYADLDKALSNRIAKLDVGIERLKQKVI